MDAAITLAGKGRSPSSRLPGLARTASELRLRALVSQYAEFVPRSLRRLGVRANDVDDATQRVFLVVFRKLDRIESSSERAYVLSTVMRVASDMRRVEARRKRREVALEDDAEAEAHTDELVELKRTRMLLDRVLANMPPSLTTVFVLAEDEGLTVLEISRRVGIPTGTVASRLRRAREAFQEQARKLREPAR